MKTEFVKAVISLRDWHGYIESYTGDFQAFCAKLLREGLYTSDEKGAIWFPPSMIKNVRMDDSTVEYDK